MKAISQHEIPLPDFLNNINIGNEATLTIYQSLTLFGRTKLLNYGKRS